MEELLEIITWSQLGIHTKPVRYAYTSFFENIFFLFLYR